MINLIYLSFWFSNINILYNCLIFDFYDKVFFKIQFLIGPLIKLILQKENIV